MKSKTITIVYEAIKLIKASFIFMPRHSDVKGNESADRLAGMASQGVGQTLVLVDILNTLRQAGQVKDAIDCYS